MNTKLLFASVALASTAGLAGLASSAHAGGLEVGAQIQVLPVGSLEIEAGGESLDTDTDTAFGLVGTVDYAVNPYISIGAAPRLVLGVKGEDDEESAMQLDLAARVTGRLPVAPKVDLFAYASPGYSLSFLPDDAEALGTPSGFLLGFGGGAAFKLSPTLSVVGELGYSMTFQSGTAETPVGDADYDYSSSFLHLGVGVKAAI